VGTISAAARVVVFEDERSVVGFLPITITRGGLARPIAPGFANCEAVVHTPEFDWEAARAGLRKRFVAWRYDKLLSVQAHRLGAADRDFEAAVMDLSLGWPAYAAWLKSAHSKTFKNNSAAMRRLAREIGELQFHYDDRDPASLRWLIDEKVLQCRENGWHNVFGDAFTRDLMERVLGQSEHDCSGIVSTLRSEGGIIVAAAFGLRSRSVHAGSILVHDRAFARFNPGWLCLLEIGKAAAEQGASRHDLGDGPEAFKEKLSSLRVGLTRGSLTHGLGGQVIRAVDASRGRVVAFGVRHPDVEIAARHKVRELRRFRYNLEDKLRPRAEGPGTASR
jgi:CelD/BcsL family acetyltransferase involved in cellulose biosynthesis